MKLKNFLDIATLKFILVGLVNTLVGMGTMFVLYNLFNASYWFSNIGNVVVGSIVSYFLNKYFTFRSYKKSIKEVIIFALNIAVCHFVSYGLAKPLVNMLLVSLNDALRTNIAFVVGAGLFVVLNYFGQRFIVFKYKKEKEEQYESAKVS